VDVDVLRQLGRLLLPPACPGCGRGPGPDRVLCGPCDAKIARLPSDRCCLCQEQGAGPDGCCAGCRDTPSPLVSCLAAAAYELETARWIQRFKYPRPGLLGLDPGPLAVVGALVREAAGRARQGADGIVPVPLHARRLRRRGFNPAGLLARQVARASGVRLLTTALVRVRDTDSQTGLDRAARTRNVAGAFRARRNVRLPRRIWLVDDVVTTRATLNEAARTLRASGADHIVGVCAARTLVARTSAEAVDRPLGARGGGCL
jgi:ComF family protein